MTFVANPIAAAAPKRTHMAMPDHLAALTTRPFKRNNSLTQAAIEQRETKRREKLEVIEEQRRIASEMIERRERRRDKIQKILDAAERVKRERAALEDIPAYMLAVDRPNKLVRIFSQCCGYSLHELCSIRRQRELAEARQILCWILKNQTKLSYPRIGSKIGDRDHSTVIHAIRKVDANPEFRERAEKMMAHVLEMEAEIYGGE